MIEKDLFRSLFDRTSRYSFDAYRRGFLNRLPSLLLQRALLNAPTVVECVGFEGLENYLKASAANRETIKNAEIFPYLNYLAFPLNNKRQLCINALRVHCGLDVVKSDTNPDVRYWRLVKGDSREKVEIAWFKGDLPLRKLGLGWLLNIHEGKIVVYRPYDGLFDDVEPRLYGMQASCKSNMELDFLLGEAFSLINSYSHSLFINILEQVSTISLLKEVNGRPISYSLRNRYIGAIFLTVSSAVEMAEQIIHEYYHQCIWPWWLFDPPIDLPCENLRVVSPISGAARSLPTLIQAILIYTSLQDFYVFANEYVATSEDRDTVNRASARVQMIENRFDDLVARVREGVIAMPATRGVCDTILQLRGELLSGLKSQGGNFL